MKIQRSYNTDRGWEDRIVIIWQEDDAPVPDKERIDQAWRRIVGNDNRGKIEPDSIVDHGDWCASLFGCWVHISSCQGSAIGVLAEVAQ